MECKMHYGTSNTAFYSSENEVSVVFECRLKASFCGYLKSLDRFKIFSFLATQPSVPLRAGNAKTIFGIAAILYKK